MRFDSEADLILKGTRIIKLATKDGRREKADLEIS